MTNAEVTRTWLHHDTTETIERMRQFMHPDHQFYNPLTPHPLRIEEHIGMLHKMRETFSNQVHHLDLVLESDNYVTVRGRISGIHTGEFNGIQATGKPIETSFNLILEFVNGKVRNEYMELNPMKIMKQIS